MPVTLQHTPASVIANRKSRQHQRVVPHAGARNDLASVSAYRSPVAESDPRKRDGRRQQPMLARPDCEVHRNLGVTQPREVDVVVTD